MKFVVYLEFWGVMGFGREQFCYQQSITHLPSQFNCKLHLLREYTGSYRLLIISNTNLTRDGLVRGQLQGGGGFRYIYIYIYIYMRSLTHFIALKYREKHNLVTLFYNNIDI